MIEYQHKIITEVHPSIRHGFFGRRGGVSTGVYDSLNCSLGSQDDPILVRQNRALVAQAIEISSENLITAHQVHSPDCVSIEVGHDNQSKPIADALVSDQQGMALGVLTADCGPILFSGLKPDGSPVIGAAHAGWGGALKGVCENTIDAMIQKGAGLETIRAVIGPCISAKSYEVTAGFETPFLAHDPESEHFFKSAKREGHFMFDLPGYIAARLSVKGIQQVVICGLDTYAEEDRFFSYRRATHRNDPDYGRQMAVIAIAQ